MVQIRVIRDGRHIATVRVASLQVLFDELIRGRRAGRTVWDVIEDLVDDVLRFHNADHTA